MKKYASEKQYTLYLGSMLDVLDTLPENSVDAIVTDPPYHLTSIVERFGKGNSAPAQYGTDGAFARASKGFMGKEWDGGDIAFQVETWKKCLRVLKPGGHLLAFNHSRTFHRMWVAIEDAGFEIRDTIMWVYGSGFPKSLNIGKAIDKMLGAEREVVGQYHGVTQNKKSVGGGFNASDTADENGRTIVKITKPSSPQAKQWDGWGTALKPAHEPICLARKPIAESSIAQNVLKYGTGGINIDGCRVGSEGIKVHNAPKGTFAGGEQGRGSDTESYRNHVGRFPANLIHDGSDEVVELFPYGESVVSNRGGARNNGDTVYNKIPQNIEMNYECGYGDSGSAARFFYTAKASQSDRDEGLDEFEEKETRWGGGRAMQGYDDNAFQRGETLRKNIHPTVKPTDLMQYLVRLVTPKGGVVLDPFMGSGSTGKAAMMENVLKGSNYHFIGIDMTEEYLPIAQARIEQGIHFEEREVTTISTDANGNKVKQVQSSIFDYLGESE